MAGTGTPVITKRGNSDNHGTCACPASRCAEVPQITPIRAVSKAAVMSLRACRLLCGCLALVPEDPVRGEGPVPQRPPERAMPDFPGERRRRNGDDWALGVGQAVTAHLAGDQPGQRTTAARTHDQQVAGAAGQIDQDPASLAPLDDRLHWRVVRDLSPGRVERIPELSVCAV